jgi:nucleoside-diphosphate-sugar epimerase
MHDSNKPSRNIWIQEIKVNSSDTSSPRGRVLITGVAGFLGSNLARKVVSENFNVVGIDNLSMGKLVNIAEIRNAPNFTFIESDITQPETFAKLGGQFEIIVHLAAFKIPRYGKAIDTLLINYEGTRQVLDFAHSQQCKTVLASTSDVYGRNPDLPFSEEHSDCVIGSSKVPRWSYAVSKLFDEHLGLAYMDAYDFPVTILRFFGSYGPNQHLTWWGGPQSVFIDAVFRDEVIPIHGDGSQTRSFTYVSDTINGIYAAMINPAANGDIFNIGSTYEITILNLAKLIKKLSNTPGEARIEFVPYESFTGKKYQDVMRRVPDMSHTRAVLGVEAKVDLEEGLSRTIEWQRSIVQYEAI